jgi:hypothetical protein
MHRLAGKNERRIIFSAVAVWLFRTDGLRCIHHFFSLHLSRAVMAKIILSVSLLLVGLSAHSVYADEHSSSALEQTMNCLQTQTCESGRTSAGQAADQKALEAVGGSAAGKQELYNISADIMPFLVTQTNGDPAKMAEIVQKAQSNPEAFFNALPADIQAKIKKASAAYGHP